MNSSIDQKWEGGPNVHHWGGPINISIYAGGLFFFFAGATAPPRGNVAPPLPRLSTVRESSASYYDLAPHMNIYSLSFLYYHNIAVFKKEKALADIYVTVLVQLMFCMDHIFMS